jgi:hypothetical protein
MIDNIEHIKKLLNFEEKGDFYMLYLPYQNESIMASWSTLEELFNLTKRVYEIDKKATRIQKIKDDINPAADLIGE